MRITSRPNYCKRCFVTIPSVTPVVKAYDSASTELKLTVCCVRDHAVSVAFRHCTAPPLVLLHGVAWPAQSLSVCSVMITIKLFALGEPFKYFTIRFKFISSLSVGHVIFLAGSFTLYMTSARSWHMYNSFPTIVLYTARLSPSSSTSHSVVGASSARSHQGFCFIQTKNNYHVPDVLRIRFHRVPSCRSLDHSAQEVKCVAHLLHSSHDSNQNLL